MVNGQLIIERNGNYMKMKVLHYLILPMNYLAWGCVMVTS